MLQRLVFLCGLGVLAFSMNAQTPFSKGFYRTSDSAFGGSFGVWEWGSDLITMPQGGWLYSESSTVYPARLFRVDTNGDLSWSRQVEQPEFHISLGLTALTDSDLMVLGRVYPASRMMHLDENGSLLGAYSFSSTSFYFDLAPLTDSSALVVGEVVLPGFELAGAIIQLGVNGQVLDAFAVTMDPDRPPSFRKVVRTMDGGFAVLARCFGGFGPMGVDTVSSGVVRLDAAGQVIWAERFDNAELNMEPASICELADGDLMISGHVDLGTGSHVERIDVLRIAPNGALRWSKRITSVGGTFDPSRFELYPWGNDELLICGSLANLTPFFLRTDTSLVVLEAHTKDGSVNGIYFDAVVGQDGVMMIAPGPGGGYNSVSPTLHWSDASLTFECAGFPPVFHVDTTIFTVVLGATVAPLPETTTDVTSAYQITPSPDLEFDPCLSTSSGTTHAISTVRIWPDPVRDLLMISAAGISKAEVVNATGGIVLSRDFMPASSIQLDLGDLDPGLYFVRIRTAEGWQTEKVIKE